MEFSWPAWKFCKEVKKILSFCCSLMIVKAGVMKANFSFNNIQYSQTACNCRSDMPLPLLHLVNEANI